MELYRILWRRVMCAVAVLGVVNAVLVLPGKNLVGLAVRAAIVGPTVGVWAHARTSHAEFPFPTPSYLLQTAALATVGAVAVVGLITMGGFTALLGLGLLVGCSPAVLHRLPVRPPQTPRSEPLVVAATTPTPTVSPVPPPCHGLSNAELCWRWRTSTTALATTVSPGQRLYLIHTRDALLDELAHRDPDGFTRWLHSDTRTVNDPAPFLTTTADPHVRPRHDR